MQLKTGKQRQSMNITGSSKKKIYKTDKHRARLRKIKRETETTNLRNETRGITTNPVIIKRMIKEYYQQLYVHRLNSLEETVSRKQQTTKTQPRWTS